MKKTIIAIFEDEIVNRFIYERLLEDKKDRIQLHIFETPEKGYEAAKEISFDVVFIEMHFWESFGGLIILEKLKEITSPKTIFAAMTSLLQKGDAERALSAGFTMCLQKPIVFSQLDFIRSH